MPADQRLGESSLTVPPRPSSPRCRRNGRFVLYETLAAQLLVADGPVIAEHGVGSDFFVRVRAGEGDKPAGMQGDEGLGNVVRYRAGRLAASARPASPRGRR
jgi:hypothetical protein